MAAEIVFATRPPMGRGREGVSTSFELGKELVPRGRGVWLTGGLVVSHDEIVDSVFI